MINFGKPAFRHYLLLFISAVALFSCFSGSTPLFDWDEINFAESSREMIVTGDYFTVQIDYRPFWEKPPLFFWMQVLSMKIFGINEFAARFPNAVIGGITLCVLLFFGSRLMNPRTGWLMAGLYAGSFLPQMYFRSGIIDPTFNLFIFLGFFHLLQFELRHAYSGTAGKHPWLAGLFTGLATLTKGPVALLVTAVAYFFFKLFNDRLKISWVNALKYIGVFSLTIGTYFGGMILFTADGAETVHKFIVYQVELLSDSVAGHAQPAYYHPVIFILGCFPLAAFAIRGMFTRPQDEKSRVIRRAMMALFWTVMILFSLVQTKIVHYSSMVYFPAVVLAAQYLDRQLTLKDKLKPDTWVILSAGLLFLSVPVLLVNYITSNPQWLQSQMTNDFSRAAVMNPVEWSGFEFLIGGLFLAAMIAGFYLLARRLYAHFVGLSAVANTLFLMLLVWQIAPRIAGYSQAPVIEFWKSLEGKNVWYLTGYHKSYAQYFYGRVMPGPRNFMDDYDKSLKLRVDPIERPVYMVAKADAVNKTSFKQDHKNFVKIGEKGGYVFFVREK